MAAGPARARTKRARILRTLLPWLALVVFGRTQATAQTLDLFNPERGGFVAPQDLPLRRTADTSNVKTSDDTGADATTDLSDPDGDATRRQRDTMAPSRIGQIPSYGVPAASGAGNTGFDSQNRNRKLPKYHPGKPRPKPPPGPGSPEPTPQPVDAASQLRLSIPPSDAANRPPLPPAMAGT
ncbi:MAG: hypothetical protein WCB02_04655, partial [Bradyrhizobium sp.]